MSSKDFTLIFDINLPTDVENNANILSIGNNKLIIYTSDEKIRFTIGSNSINCIPGIPYMVVCIFKNNGYIELILYVKENLTKVGSIKLNSNINLQNTITENDITIYGNTSKIFKPYIINESDIHLYANGLITKSPGSIETKPIFTKPNDYDNKISLFKFNKIRINLKGVFDKLNVQRICKKNRIIIKYFK
jgi:hypothetical protein